MINLLSNGAMLKTIYTLFMENWELRNSLSLHANGMKNKEKYVSNTKLLCSCFNG